MLCINTVADGEQKGYVTSAVYIRVEPGTENDPVSDKAINGCIVDVLGSKEDKDKDLWYKIRTVDGIEGYIFSGKVQLQTTPEYNENFEQNLLNFPESYRNLLRDIHNFYPNWQFVAHNVNIAFDTVVDAEYGTSVTGNRKYVELTYKGEHWRDPRANQNGVWLQPEPRWTYASRQAIAYYMDPRNSLSLDKIFVFMQQSYDPQTQTKDTLRSVVANTFLENGYGDNKDAYIDDIMQAATESGVSPYVIASTIIVEQGTSGGNSQISGTYSGYEGYYNFFNYGASGATTQQIIVSGLEHAKAEGWNSRRNAIIGGAKEYADGYISEGQDTYYYKDFNVVNINKIWHQYENSLYGAWTKASYLKKGCITNRDATLIFKIPVYNGMPPSAVSEPTLNPTPTPSVSIKKGDINSDGKINVVDLASVKLHILGRKTLSGNAFSCADINGDGAVNVIDMASVKLHILGKKTIS